MISTDNIGRLIPCSTCESVIDLLSHYSGAMNSCDWVNDGRVMYSAVW